MTEFESNVIKARCGVTGQQGWSSRQRRAFSSPWEMRSHCKDPWEDRVSQKVASSPLYPDSEIHSTHSVSAWITWETVQCTLGGVCKDVSRNNYSMSVPTSWKNSYLDLSERWKVNEAMPLGDICCRGLLLCSSFFLCPGHHDVSCLAPPTVSQPNHDRLKFWNQEPTEVLPPLHGFCEVLSHSNDRSNRYTQQA